MREREKERKKERKKEREKERERETQNTHTHTYTHTHTHTSNDMLNLELIGSAAALLEGGLTKTLFDLYLSTCKANKKEMTNQQ